MSNMFLNIVSTFENKGITAATKQLGAFGTQAGGLGSVLGKVGATLASFGIAAKAVQFTKQSIDSARDLQRNMYSLNTVFDELTPGMEKFTKEAANIGLSQKDAAKASVFLGSVLKQSGFSMDYVSGKTQELVGLAVDLAATYGYDVQEALLGMTALFRGEYDPIEKFGVAMKQNEINSELAARGQDKLQGALRRNAEQVVRIELLTQRASDATGAFAGQSGNLYVEQKKLQAQFENIQASIGQQLLPVIGTLVEALVPLIDYLGPKIAQAVTDSIPAIEGLVSLLKDMSDSSTTTGKTMEFLTGTFSKFFAFIAENFGVLVQLTLLIGAVTAALQVYAVVSAFVAANPIAAGLIILGAAFIVGANGAKTLTDDVNLAGASLKAFNGNLEGAAQTGVFVGGKIGMLKLDFVEASNEAKRLSGEVSAADKARMDNLRNSILGVRISAAEAANEVARMRKYAGLPDIKFATTPVSTSLTAASGGGSASPQAAIAKEQGVLDDRLDVYKSFADSVKGLFGQIKDSILGAFDLPTLGNSVNSITRNMGKLLEKTKSFAANIAQLSGMGLNSTLLQQVISAGPMAGAQLASALVGGGGSFIDQINSAYGEFGNLASGIAGSGTMSAFDNASQRNIYNIEVNGGVGSGPTIGKAIVDAIKSYERTSGAVWQGA